MVALGRVNIVAGGTPQALTASQSADKKGKILLQAAVGNTHVVYVGLKGMNTSSGVGLLGVVGIPAATGPLPWFEIEVPLAPGGVMANQIYIDGTTNEGVYVSIY